MSAPKNICIDCGLCSDGSIFRHGPIEEGDRLEPLKRAGAEFVTIEATPSFLQPCPAFTGGCCSIYENRPAACREYRCFLLRRYEAGKVSFEEARRLITRAITLRDRVRPALTAFVAPTGSQALSRLYRLMHQKFDAMPDPTAARREVADLLLDIGALRVVLAREFEASDSGSPPADLTGTTDRALSE